jgi:thymidylate synthase (FAD)
MNVKLVSLTNSMVQEKALSPEELIVYVARVSNPSNQLNSETSDKLTAYLVKNKHWSPFEMVDMCVEIVTSRGIAQQILRHRSFSFQEFSQRYAKVNDMEAVQLRYQADKNRQSSTDVLSEEDAKHFEQRLKQVIDLSQEVYSEMLDKNVAKECARFVLPITTQTKIYMKGSIRSWIHYLQIRCDAHTQLEHRQIALAILDIFKANFPNISKALGL